jgi:hypothetical protein
MEWLNKIEEKGGLLWELSKYTVPQYGQIMEQEGWDNRDHRIRSRVGVWPTQPDLPNALWAIIAVTCNPRDAGNVKIQDLLDFTTCQVVK